MQVSSHNEDLPQKTKPFANIMLNSVMLLEQLHEKITNQNWVIHIHLNPDITIQIPSYLDMLLEYDPNIK